MINEKRLELLQNAILTDMAEKINQRRNESKLDKISISDEEVFSNLKFIYDEQKEMEFGEETGKSFRYMPKQYKAMTMRLIAPDYCFSHKINHTDTAVTVEAFLFLDKEDSKPIATGKATVAYSSIPHDDKTEWEVKMYCESTAKGLAESKAYQVYGIGSWYSYRYDAEDNPDIAIDTMQQKSSLNPIKAEPEPDVHNDSEKAAVKNSVNKIEDKNEMDKSSEPHNINSESEHTDNDQKSEMSEETEAFSYVQATMEEMQEQIEDAGKETKEENDLSSNMEQETETQNHSNATAGVMSLEDARAHKAMIGKAHSKGLTLGETCDLYPANIAWMYANAKNSDLSNEDILALTVVAKSNNAIMDALKNYGLSLD